MTDQQVTELLASCSPARLIQILAPALAAQTQRDTVGSRLVLCEFYPDNERSDAVRAPSEVPWLINLVTTPPTLRKWEAFEGQGYWESGSCDQCQVEIASYAKEGVCPLCRATIELT